MRVGVPQESIAGEARVAVVPDGVGKLKEAGLDVMVQMGAGAGAYFSDDAYREAGAEIAADGASVIGGADIVLKVQPPSEAEIAQLAAGTVIVSFLQPGRQPDLVRALAHQRVTALSMHRVPRITRAQAMDALSSQSNIAGYKAVLVGAAKLAKLMPMLTTAAGTMAPAKVFVLGAGVAGLQAIATARRLGAVVVAFDVRPAVKEQVASLGARFLEVELVEQGIEDAGGYAKELSEESHRQAQALLQQAVQEMDLVITTALIPDKPAPVLITEAMVDDMRSGAVVVDLAAEAGGNCALTEADREVVRNGVHILGPTNLASSVAAHASQMYSRNVTTLLLSLVREGEVSLDFDDEIVAASCVTHAGDVRD